MREKPSSRAMASRSIPKLLPASAPEPIGQASALSAACCRRVRSREKASACASRKCESKIGCACCMCVMPAIGTPRFALAWRRNESSSAERALRFCVTESMTNKRNSVATSSLRLRPVWSFQPSGPSSSTSAFSTKWCTSSASAPKVSSHVGSVWARSEILTSAVRVCCSSVFVQMPIFSSAMAQTESTAISYTRRRRSNANEHWNASKRLFGSRSKRPPQRRSSLRSVISTRVGRSGCSGDGVMRSRVAFGFSFGADGDGQGEEVDEAFGVFGIVAAHGETGEVGAIERERRDALGDSERALPQFEADGAGHALLRDVKKTVERGAQRRKPQAVVNQLGVTQRKRLLKMRGLAIHGKRFEFAMRGDQQRAAGSFVRAARLHADQAIFDDVGAADTVLRGDLVQRVQQFDCGGFRAVHGDGKTGFRSELDFRAFVLRLFRRGDPLPHGFVGRIGGIFELAAFVAE